LNTAGRDNSIVPTPSRSVILTEASSSCMLVTAA